MNIKKRLAAGMMVMGMTLIAGTMTVSAAQTAKKIAIRQSVKSVKVGSVVDLDSKITPARARVRDRTIIWTSSNSKVLKVLEKRDDDTKVKALKAGKATITVQIKGTKIKAQRTITVKKKSSSSSLDSYQKKISAQSSQLTEVEKEIQNTVPAAGLQDRRVQYGTLQQKLEQIDNELDQLDEYFEDKYEMGKLSRTEYRSLERLIESAENACDMAEETLDSKFNYEFDD